MTRYDRRRLPSVSLPSFDPAPSAELGVEVLTQAGAAFALVGRVAMWTLMPDEDQEFTKDVDFAVPQHAIEAIRQALAARGLTPRELPIGGLAVHSGDIRVDFIDRREGGLDGLYRDAIDDANQRGIRVTVGDKEIPVVRPEYLVALKVVAGEDRDEHDAVLCLRALPEIDLPFVREVIARHGGPAGANRLDALARRAGRPDARPAYRNGGTPSSD